MMEEKEKLSVFQ